MKPKSIRKALIAAALIGVTTMGTATIAVAQQGGYGMGPGMMGGNNSGPNAGSGYGPGMMGGGSYGGPGAGGGYGPGMMGGGYGMGPGMMGGGGYGMGHGMLYQLNLTAEQWGKVRDIQQDQAKKNWDAAGKTLDEAYKLQRLMSAEKRDRAAIINQYKKLQEMRTLMFQASLDAQEKIEGVLSKEQKEQLRRFGQ